MSLLNVHCVKRTIARLLLSIFLTVALPLSARAATGETSCLAIYPVQASATPILVTSEIPPQTVWSKVRRFFTGPEISEMYRASDVTQEEFDGIADVANKIVTLYPPESSVYVGLGRSPTPFTAYLEAQGLTNVLHLPLSKMRSYPDPTPRAEAEYQQPEQSYSAPLTDRFRDKLYKHFSHHLPSAISLRGKRLILIDYISSGASLAAAKAYVDLYYRGASPPVSVIALPITYHAERFVEQLKGVPSIEVTSAIVGRRLIGQHYDVYSPNASYDLRSMIRDIKSDQAYKDFIADLEKRIHATH